MPVTSAAHRSKETAVTVEAARSILLGSLLFAAAASIFWLLFNRENALSYSIGYNLYGAERFLEGETPYTDFHTLYPPATLFINAALFRLLGASLYWALFAVMLFKLLTTLMIYLCGLQIMPRAWAVAAAAFSIVWLRPNGPFKAVPMHYGALFLAVALYALLRYLRRERAATIFASGVALGLLALFKHNIGAYALAGSIAVLLLRGQARPALDGVMRNARAALVLLAGFAAALAPALAYMASRGALAAMAKTLLLGPGDFLLERLAAAPPSPAALAVGLYLWACGVAAHKFKASAFAAALFCVVALGSVAAFILTAKQSHVDSLIFYGPVAVLAAAPAVYIFSLRLSATERQSLLAVFAAAAAAFMETFPRFAREQTIGAMPFVMLLLFYLLYIFRPALREFSASPLAGRLAIALLPVAFLLMGGRLFFNTFFDGGLSFRSTTALSFERGRGVLFPEKEARKIDEVVSYIHQRVPEGGYFFPQSYAGSSFLFLANRKNISGAQFWGGVGVTDAERAETVKALDESNVGLILTRQSDLAAEKYAPMREYIDRNFELTKQVDDVLILQRRTASASR